VLRPVGVVALRVVLAAGSHRQRHKQPEASQSTSGRCTLAVAS
jgi:hypothetical protein